MADPRCLAPPQQAAALVGPCARVASAGHPTSAKMSPSVMAHHASYLVGARTTIARSSTQRPLPHKSGGCGRQHLVSAESLA